MPAGNMMWRALLVISTLVLYCNADFDVSVSRYCGKTLYVGQKLTNGFITLQGREGILSDMPGTCEVELVADPGYAIYVRFKAINFRSCDERVEVIYQQKGVAPENVFDSKPHFCGREVISGTPVMITYDDSSTNYKIQFTKDTNSADTTSTFLFDYTTKLIGDGGALIWPVAVKVTTESAVTEEVTDMIEETTTSYEDITTEEWETSTIDMDPSVTMPTESDPASTEMWNFEDTESTTDAIIDTTFADERTTFADERTTFADERTTFAEKETTNTNIETTFVNIDSTLDIELETTTMDVEEMTSAGKVYPTKIMEPSTKAPFVLPSKGPFSCSCSVGFEKADGSHHLLEDFPNLIPDSAYTIQVLAGPSACEAAQQRCDSFCKIMVVARMGSDGLKKYRLRSDFLKILAMPPSQRSKLNSTLGGYVCEHHKTAMSGEGSELFVFSHLPQCNPQPQEVEKLAENFCCDGYGNHVQCVTPLTSRCECMVSAGNLYNRGIIGTALPLPKMITIASAPYCTAGSKQCVQYCKSAGYHLITNRAQAFSTFQGISETVGDRVCSLSNKDVPPNAMSLRLMSNVQCPNDSTSMVADLGQICCKDNHHIPCSSYYPSTTASPAARCQCAPLFRSGTKYKTFDAVYKTTVYSTGSCDDAETECAKQCHKYIGGTMGSKAKIADGVCKSMGTSALTRGNNDQTLELLAIVQASSTCKKPPAGLIVETVVSRDFCCSGGFRSMYKNCSSLYRPTIAPTTRNWWYTTRAPKSTIQCQCSPKYVRGVTTYKTFPAMFTTNVDFSRGCTYAASLCKQRCARYFQSGVGGRFGSMSTTSINRQIINDTCGQLYPRRPLDYSRLQVYATLKGNNCHPAYSSSLVKTVTSTYCCYRGQYASCSGRQPNPTTAAPTASYGYNCQCIPLYYNNTAGIETERRFSSVYNISIPFSSGCTYAMTRCTTYCAQYLSGSSASVSQANANKIADKMCQQIYTPFKVRQPYQSFLELHSLISPAQCPSSKERYVKTISQGFCCSGAGGSRSRYVKCHTIEQQSLATTRRPYYTTRRPYYTTRRPYYTTRRPYYTTKRPSSQVVSCQCTLGLKYSSSGYTFKSISMPNLITGFPTARYASTSTRACSLYRSSCRGHCLRTTDKYVKDGVTSRTPYGYKLIDDAVCIANRKTVQVPFDLGLKYAVTGSGCSVYYYTVKTYNRDICCTTTGSTPCRSVVG